MTILSSPSVVLKSILVVLLFFYSVPILLGSFSPKVIRSTVFDKPVVDMGPSSIQSFKLNASLFNRALFTRVYDLWFAEVPRGATGPPKEALKRWFGFGSPENRAVFDAECSAGFKSALESIGPQRLSLPAFTTYEAERKNAHSIAAPFLTLDEVRNRTDEERAETALGLVLLLDQLSRNIFRDNQSVVYGHYDRLSRALTHCILASPSQENEASNPYAGAHVHPTFKASPPYRMWFYMPLMHSEDLTDHRTFEKLVGEMKATHQGDEGATHYVDQTLSVEKKHCEIIEKFGRYPYRNKVLSRETTSEERQWVENGGDNFGTG